MLESVESLSDDELLAVLEAGNVSHTAWNHKAHVRAAYVYISRHGLDVAYLKMRAALLKLNVIHAAPHELKRGYHDTITRAFLQLIADRTKLLPKVYTSHEVCDIFPELLDRQLLLKYYSPEQLWTWTAKEQFVEPDLQPLQAMATLCEPSA